MCNYWTYTQHRVLLFPLLYFIWKISYFMFWHQATWLHLRLAYRRQECTIVNWLMVDRIGFHLFQEMRKCPWNVLNMGTCVTQLTLNFGYRSWDNGIEPQVGSPLSTRSAWDSLPLPLPLSQLMLSRSLSFINKLFFFNKLLKKREMSLYDKLPEEKKMLPFFLTVCRYLHRWVRCALGCIWSEKSDGPSSRMHKSF